MNTARVPVDSLSSKDAQCLDRCVEQFERAWHRGERPALEAYLPASGAVRRAVLTELVHAEIELRLKAGESVHVEAYLERFPELPHDDAVVRSLLAAAAGSHRWSHPPEGHPGGLRRDHVWLGRFKVLGVLGAGAFGTVYKAADTHLDRIVALKVPRGGSLPSQVEADWFLREARSAAQLRHPGIVAVYDAGQAEGTCYLVS
jgi:hypothetical protein